MKKSFAVLMIMITLLAFAACSRNAAPSEETSSVTSIETTDVSSTDSAETTEKTAAEVTGEDAAASETATETTTVAADNNQTTENAVSIDAFMGTWHYTDEEMKATWKMEQKGDTVQVTLSGTFADGETMTQTADCAYQFKNGVLELFSDEYEGGKLTLQFTGKDELTATVNSDVTAPIIMTR